MAAKKYTIRQGYFVTCKSCQKMIAAEKAVSVVFALRGHTKKHHPEVSTEKAA